MVPHHPVTVRRWALTNRDASRRTTLGHRLTWMFPGAVLVWVLAQLVSR